jgi:5-methylcytosine-specific restriction endonuclease McrA
MDCAAAGVTPVKNKSPKIVDTRKRMVVPKTQQHPIPVQGLKVSHPVIVFHRPSPAVDPNHDTGFGETQSKSCAVTGVICTYSVTCV